MRFSKFAKIKRLLIKRSFVMKSLNNTFIVLIIIFVSSQLTSCSKDIEEDRIISEISSSVNNSPDNLPINGGFEFGNLDYWRNLRDGRYNDRITLNSTTTSCNSNYSL